MQLAIWLRSITQNHKHKFLCNLIKSLPSSGFLRGVRWFKTDVSGLHMCNYIKSPNKSDVLLVTIRLSSFLLPAVGTAADVSDGVSAIQWSSHRGARTTHTHYARTPLRTCAGIRNPSSPTWDIIHFPSFHPPESSASTGPSNFRAPYPKRRVHLIPNTFIWRRSTD
jgi:hypothetical protein